MISLFDSSERGVWPRKGTIFQGRVTSKKSGFGIDFMLRTIYVGETISACGTMTQ